MPSLSTTQASLRPSDTSISNHHAGSTKCVYYNGFRHFRQNYICSGRVILEMLLKKTPAQTKLQVYISGQFGLKI